MIILTHAGLSQAEAESLFKLLEDFGVEERYEDITNEYVSMIYLELPLAYDPEFFRIIGFDRWEELKMLFKNIKWRRGNKRFKLTLCFNSEPRVEFSLLTTSDRAINKALDSLEYLVDNLTLQLKSVINDDIKSIIYRFDEDEYRWHIYSMIDYNGEEYKYINNRWVKL